MLADEELRVAIAQRDHDALRRLSQVYRTPFQLSPTMEQRLQDLLSANPGLLQVVQRAELEIIGFVFFALGFIWLVGAVAAAVAAVSVGAGVGAWAAAACEVVGLPCNDVMYRSPLDPYSMAMGLLAGESGDTMGCSLATGRPRLDERLRQRPNTTPSCLNYQDQHPARNIERHVAMSEANIHDYRLYCENFWYYLLDTLLFITLAPICICYFDSALTHLAPSEPMSIIAFPPMLLPFDEVYHEALGLDERAVRAGRSETGGDVPFYRHRNVKCSWLPLRLCRWVPYLSTTA